MSWFFTDEFGNRYVFTESYQFGDDYCRLFGNITMCYHDLVDLKLILNV